MTTSDELAAAINDAVDRMKRTAEGDEWVPRPTPADFALIDALWAMEPFHPTVTVDQAVYERLVADGWDGVTPLKLADIRRVVDAVRE